MRHTTPYPPARPQSDQTGFWTVVTMRVFFGILFVLVLDYAVDLGTSPALLCVTMAVGVLGASRLAAGRLTHLGFVLLLGALYALFFFLFEIVSPRLYVSEQVFKPYVLARHAGLGLAVLSLAALSTWCFWRLKQALVFELIALAGLSVFLLAGHRNYRFDLVKTINNLAWYYNLNPLTVLVLLGVAIFLGLSGYFFATTPTSKPDFSRPRHVQILHRGPTNYFGAIILLILASLLLSLISVDTYRRHRVTATLRTQKGVGDTHKEGLSPLTFQSALGSSNQPAALVRLEGDYRQNPFMPMLYLRESALSHFDGRELVAAGPGYDRDVSRTKPSQSYSADSDTTLDFRIPVTQSIYLLTEHNLAFGIDYPIYITGLKLPTTSSRFKSAYRVYSMAPAFGLDEIKNLPVGDPRWSPAERQHYLETNPDPRYHDLAERISADSSTPVEKAFAVATYLSKVATYTLTPHHQVEAGGDPVAPFLFGDNRGYCVHFAHAISFMLRSIGIPARIGTGYLTDLSQSKDGHILLRMSDRHAWAEVFISGRGWVPFDVKPEKVESHAETPVDLGLLEELMGLLGPSEEILPKNIIDDEARVKDDTGFRLPQIKDLTLPFALLLTVLVVVKVYLLYSWRLPGGPEKRLKRAYRGWLVRLHDAGIRRGYGETRLEFDKRLHAIMGITLTPTTRVLNAANYSADSGEVIDIPELHSLASTSNQELKRLPWTKKVLSLINPASVFAQLGGGRW
ncbi:MAG: hypothetical protein GX589_06740 [Deltaproteobacteria bacterium]|nr:hypothetical protein [Deltaproteobacteria bacterium]